AVAVGGTGVSVQSGVGVAVGTGLGTLQEHNSVVSIRNTVLRVSLLPGFINKKPFRPGLV
ncbi:MAG: hypothetical protein IJI45_05045, partial [Anaerolineaceae bacterium]|nr:hypothetical protein [Anaerolineaceae bacterium]